MLTVSDAAFELMVIVWIMASPIAIAKWVSGFEDPVSWAAFISGVLGVLVGWIVIAPYESAKRRKASAAGS
jgi:uncharacterized membrane protein HdeD (DUF308 family)